MPSKHNQGIDLLRILSMFMVAILHVLGQGGVLFSVEPQSVHYHTAWLLEIAAYCAVNCYALISGYVGWKSQFQPRKMLHMWLTVFFYSASITLIFAISKPGSVGIKEYIRGFFPVMSMQYWYFTAYFALFFVAPFINEGMKTLPRRTLDMILVGVALTFSILTVFFRADPFQSISGYSAFWLAALYFIGAYMNKYGLFRRIPNIWLLIVYAACIFVSWGTKLIMESLTLRYFGEAKWGSVFVAYTSPTILLSAMVLCALFAKLRIKEWMHKPIAAFSASAFAVYLIHTHPLVFGHIIGHRYLHYALYSPAGMVLAVLITSAAIFLCTAFIDMMRIRLFKLCKIMRLAECLEAKAAALIHWLLALLTSAEE